MATGSTAAGIRSTVVVIGPSESTVPDWVRPWCAWTQREMVLLPTEPTPARGPGEELWADATSEVASLARRSAAVLVNRPAPPATAQRRVVAAVKDMPSDAGVLDDAVSCAEAVGGCLAIVHAVPLSFAERSVGLPMAVAHGHEVLEAAEAACAGCGVPVSSRLLRSHPHEIVIEEAEADVLVVGYTRAGLAPGLGNVALSAIHHAACPVLVSSRS